MKKTVMVIGRVVLVVSACMLLSVWAPTGADAGDVPVFSLAWSEYPSWSTFGVAHEFNLIHGAKGEMGPVEKRWGVDIELKEADYDTCLVMYGAGKTDAVCITNMDALNPSLSVPSVMILPTSTSYGADACIVTEDIKKVEQLKGKKVYGLAKTVSEYCFERNLELLGQQDKDYTFTNMDPAAAALAMQQKRKGFDAIVVWNPFVLETLNKRKDVHVLFDSTSIPGEIIDTVVVSQSALDRPAGESFASAVIDVFYEINRRIDDPKTRDETLIALGEKFSHLDLESMKKAVEQTKFYDNPKAGNDVLSGDATKGVMDKVTRFCVKHEMVPRKPSIGYGDKLTAPNVALRLDPTYIQNVQAGGKGK